MCLIARYLLIGKKVYNKNIIIFEVITKSLRGPKSG